MDLFAWFYYTSASGLNGWISSINNMMWYSFSSCKGKKIKDFIIGLDSIPFSTNPYFWNTRFLSFTKHLTLIYCLQFFLIIWPPGDPELLKEKLMSIPGHISNEHQFPDNKKYRSCPHPPLTGERAKAWLPSGSLVKTIDLQVWMLRKTTFLCVMGVV